MRIIHSPSFRVVDYPIDGNTAAIAEGAVLMPGVTDENNRSVAILATGAAADSIGILKQAHAASAASDSDPDAGTVYTKRPVEVFLPGCEVAAELANDADNDVDVASATSTVLTVTSIEDDIDGSWIYVRAGTGVGQLLYQTASASGTATIKSASTTTLDSTSKILILRRLFHKAVALNGTTNPGTAIASSAAAGSLPWRVIGHEIKKPGSENWVPLNPVNDHNLQFGSATVGLRLILVPVDTTYDPVAV